MDALIPALLTAGLTVLAGVPLLARWARAWGLVDVPSGRSTHERPVPRIGGLALVLGIGSGVTGLVLSGGLSLDAMDAWWPYLLPAGGYLLIGLADDRFRLPARWKFVAQAGAAAYAVFLGLRWGGEALGPFGALTFGPATPFMTWLWLVAVVILVNFLDGLDCITVAGSAVVLSAAWGGAAGPGAGALYAIAAVAVLGLTFWNVTPARTFPGDSATHLLGFLVASVALELPGQAGVGLTHALPWAAASAPLVPGVIDVALGLLDKQRHGVSLARAHNQHLSQRLTKRGRPHVAVALRYGALSLAALGLVAWVSPRYGLGVCLLAALVLLLWHLGGGLRETHDLPYRFE